MLQCLTPSFSAVLSGCVSRVMLLGLLAGGLACGQRSMQACMQARLHFFQLISGVSSQSPAAKLCAAEVHTRAGAPGLPEGAEPVPVRLGQLFLTLHQISFKFHRIHVIRPDQRRCAGFHTRAVLVHQVFLKVLSLSPAEWAHFSTGRVFNLVTSDVETLQLLSQSIMNLISSPLRIIVSISDPPLTCEYSDTAQ